MAAVLRVFDVAPARKLVAFLALLAPALPVALPGDHRIARPFPADPAGGDHELDRGHAVFHALRMVLNPARMQQKARARRPPELGGFDDEPSGYAGDLRRIVGRVSLDDFAEGLKARRVLGDEGPIDPSALDHDVQHSVEDTDVTAGSDGNEQIRRTGNGSHAGVEHDEPGAAVPGLP